MAPAILWAHKWNAWPHLWKKGWATSKGWVPISAAVHAAKHLRIHNTRKQTTYFGPGCSNNITRGTVRYFALHLSCGMRISQPWWALRRSRKLILLTTYYQNRICDLIATSGAPLEFNRSVNSIFQNEKTTNSFIIHDILQNRFRLQVQYTYTPVTK